MTYERSIVNNFESCHANVPDDVRTAADVADATQGWEYEGFEATYQAQALSDYDREAIEKEHGENAAEIEMAVLAECSAWAERVGQKIMYDTDLAIKDRIVKFIALHDPVLSDEKIAAKLKDYL